MGAGRVTLPQCWQSFLRISHFSRAAPLASNVSAPRSGTCAIGASCHRLSRALLLATQLRRTCSPQDVLRGRLAHGARSTLRTTLSSRLLTPPKACPPLPPRPTRCLLSESLRRLRARKMSTYA